MHISICICTYHRPQLLIRLLDGLRNQDSQGHFSYSIVIADNDFQESARKAVQEFQHKSAVSITYCVEPTRSISLARNRAIKHSKGDMIAFIDDDEFPPPNWLFLLFKNLTEYQVSGVFGPVRPHFDSTPPIWITKGRFFERPEHPTGFIMPWRECRTGNVLIRHDVIDKMEAVFDPLFGADAEDIDLFRRLIIKGHRFIWCNEAYVYEVISPNRWKRRFMIDRALLRGKISLLHPEKRYQSIMKSLAAIPVYGIALPFLQILGHHFFMKYLIKFFDHTGKILALLGINPIRERQM